MAAQFWTVLFLLRALFFQQQDENPISRLTKQLCYIVHISREAFQKWVEVFHQCRRIRISTYLAGGKFE